MEKIIKFVVKYKIHILSSLLAIFLFRSCIKSSKLKKSEKMYESSINQIDSLKNVIKNQDDSINMIPQIIKNERISVHEFYDIWISKRDRSQQLMELHGIIKTNIQKERR